MKLLYEKYHNKRKLQKKIINKNDFTYRGPLILLRDIKLTGKKILDVGCGVGTLDFYLASNGANVVGIDISSKAIKVAKQNANYLGVEKKVFFSRMDFQKNVPRGKFDIVLCLEVLEHVVNDSQVLGKICLKLKKGGFLICSSPSSNSPLYRLGYLDNFDKEVGHLRRYTLSEYQNLLRKNGYTILRTIRQEGIVRNWLFTSKLGGLLLRLLNKQPFSLVVTFIDNITARMFGESDILILAQKK